MSPRADASPRSRLARFVALAALWLVAATAGATPRFEVVVAVAADDTATPLWQAMLAARIGADAAQRHAAEARPVSASEQAWVDLIRRQAGLLPAEWPSLQTPFAPAQAPEAIRIVIGNRGGEDAFVHDARTIGFDAARLQAEYGPADDPENVARALRFLRHESTHLLQRAWLAQRPPWPDDPWSRTLLHLWKEGHGNLHSLSDRWWIVDADANPAGRYSDLAEDTLAQLVPTLVGRLGALACADPRHVPNLEQGLSMGPFARKWGAVPMALWLKRAQSRHPQALRDFVQAGPAGVPAFIRAQLDEAQRPWFDAVVDNATRCAAGAAER
jgi:hypothetical protein